ncbi:MAG: hypothetical protein E7L09_05590 [Enterobacteriaceae bacterium]|nr:hypothetical protein [Enterobacteriaceae bacterium]
MTASITPAMDEMFAALRSFLLDLLPSLTECRQAQMNRTAMPKGDFAVMTPIHSQGLSTTRVRYQFDGTAGSETHSRVTEWRCQIDFYGNNAQENATTISTITRTDYSCEWFRRYSNDNGYPLLVPVFCSDPKQTAMINGEDQWENRWTCEFFANIPAAVTVPQQFMTNASVLADSVGAKYPPENG